MQAIPIYRLNDLTKEPINGNVYESELQKVDKDEDNLWYIEKQIKMKKSYGILKRKLGKENAMVKFSGQ